MKFQEIMDEVKAIEFTTTRVNDDDYFEAVVLRDKVPLLVEKLKKLFGEPLLPSSNKLPEDVEEAIKDFGGARDDQTLFFLKDAKYSYFAMLWPWSDEYHITIKVGLNKT